MQSTVKTRGGGGADMKPSNVRYGAHGVDFVKGLDELYGSGKFADVKMVCGDGGALWSHRSLLAAVSPVLRSVLLDFGSEDVVTLIMPHLRRSHLKLVLDYVYRGSMYLRAHQMAHVIGVIEVLHLKCGVSVSKRQDSECDWVEEGEFEDVSDKAFNDLCHFIKSEPPIKPEIKLEKIPAVPHIKIDAAKRENPADSELEMVPKLREEDFEEGEPVEVRPIAAKKSPQASKMSSSEDSSAVEEVLPESSDEADEAEKEVNIKCVMCGKVFNHQSNLRVHIQSHLGSKAKLKSCQDCNRNFRSATEHELHLRSHEMARKIKKTRNVKRELCVKILNGSRKSLVNSSVHTLNTVNKRGDLYKKYVAKVLKQRKRRKERLDREKSLLEQKSAKEPTGKVKLKIKVDPNKFKSPPSSTPSMLAPLLKKQVLKPVGENQYSCIHCPKVFSSRSSFMRHSRAQHRIDTRAKDFLDSITPSTSGSTEKRRLSSPSLPQSKKIKLSISKKKNLQDQPFLSPGSSPGYGASPTYSGSGSKGIRRSIEQDLTCPTCDKVFLAKSIFERHLKTYKHGRYQLLEGADKVPEYIPEGGTNHMNIVLQPTMEVDGKEVNKFECHLCHQVFLRVKDLAKHRQRMCTAWQN